MLLASGYPPGHTSRPHLLPLHPWSCPLQLPPTPLHLESTIPTSPPTPLRPRRGQPLSLHEVRRPCPSLSRGRFRVEP